MDLLRFIILCLLTTATSGVQIVDQPECHLDVIRGESKQLKCVFDEVVDCVWERDGQQVELPEGRYTYDDEQQNGRQTTNCNIRITDANEADEGRWTCSSAVTHDNDESVKGPDIRINLKNPSVVEHPPKELVVDLGHIVAISCQWDTQVYCKWKHNNIPVTKNKYRYNKRDSNCSLVIRGVGVEDEGAWKCGDGQNESTTSQETQLKIEHQPGSLIFGCSKGLLCSKGASEEPKYHDTAMYCKSSDAYPTAVLKWIIQPLDSDIDVSFPSKQQQNQQNPNGTFNSVLKLNQKDFDYLTDNFHGFNLFCSSEHSLKTEKVLVIHFIQSMKSTTTKPSLRHFYLTTTEATNAPETTKDVATGSSSGDSFLAPFIIFFLASLGLSGFIIWEECNKKKSKGGKSESATSKGENKDTAGEMEMQVKDSNRRRDEPEEEPSNEAESLLNEQI